MATTAKQSSSTVRSPSAAAAGTGATSEGQEDIATIAKQISDHAEAIYQTWKARGLAPTEILNCHTGSDAFGKTLTPSSSSCQRVVVGRDSQSPVAELLAQAPDMSNNNLEKLVNSFVSEDKARIAAARKSSSPSPIAGIGSIKHTLQKFESNTSGGNSVVKPKFTRTSSPQPSAGVNNALNKNVPDVLIDTIEQNLGKREREPSPQKPQTPAKPANLINHVPSWPLKNRVVVGKSANSGVGGGSVGRVEDETPTSTAVALVRKQQEKQQQQEKHQLESREAKKKTADLMDEVTREEERLINALKTGTVLNNDKSLPEVITSTLNQDVTDATANPTGELPQWNNSDLAGHPPIDASHAKVWNNTGTTTTKPVIPHINNNNNNNNVIVNKEKEDTPAPTKVFKPRTLRTTEAAILPHHLPEPQVKVKDKTANPIRPFLTRGSVAERVLIFERCPSKAPPRNALKEPSKLQSKTPLPKPQQTHTTLQRHIKGSVRSVYIPRFHFPNGKPPPQISVETTTQRIQSTVHQFPNSQIHRDEFHQIVATCGFPVYWRAPLFNCTQHTPSGCVDGYKFVDFWKHMSLSCHDAPSRFVYILSKGNRSRPYILPEDLAPLVQDVVETHPGLAFLKEAAEFHSRYVHTVIARIFYSVNRSWSGRITVSELRRSNLLQVIQLLEEEEDINQIMAYFSYEHFYVIYCKFWELDRDHDLLIDQNDLARHNDHALSLRMIERIFSGCVTRGGIKNRNMGPNGPRITYTDFVWFLLSEEDKSNPTAIEYWFRCMDLDGDGILSMYELEYFYEEQQQRMESIGIETLPFEDCICQMLDMIKPVRPGCITLGDLKKCKMTPIFFDTFFNLEKYLEHEQRDPFATSRDNDDMSDWDRYAAQEYELLVAEEGGGDTQGLWIQQINTNLCFL
ncbi:uncharacterized protein LOC129809801 isoform X2 [Phlebotomus papatasi]|uniref:uncharacterized protein LOC129809801 isoform X2 n=1 Tax=Phlebotomus papatasi TaxID=29031 RepID=UPI0024843823|nr:uncharacterized protein LOC129809801 isoform X2 [Phlebotomus papatasi]